MEANKWDTIVHTYIHSYRDQCRGAYLFQEAKRLRHAEIELAHLDLYREHLQRGADAALETFPRFDLGGMDAERQFIEAYNQLPNTVPIYSLAEGKAAHSRFQTPRGTRFAIFRPQPARRDLPAAVLPARHLQQPLQVPAGILAAERGRWERGGGRRNPAGSVLDAEPTHRLVAEDRVRPDGGDEPRGVVPADDAGWERALERRNVGVLQRAQGCRWS